MTLTSPTYDVDTTFAGKNISSAASVYQHTATASGRILITVALDAVAGGGDYVLYLTHQWAGAGTTYQTPSATFTIGAGVTALEFPTIPLDIKINDVVDVYITGQAGDTSEAGKIRIVRDNYSVLAPTDVWSDSTAPAGADVSTLAVTDILSDSTAFPGAYIDATISSVIQNSNTVQYTKTNAAQIPAIVNWKVAIDDDWSALLDFDIALTGATFASYIVPENGGTNTTVTVTNTDLSAGQVTVSLTDTQLTALGVGKHFWYFHYTLSSVDRRALAGDFEIVERA